MNIKQTNAKRLKYATVNSLIVTFSVAIGSAISGIINNNYMKIFTLEYVIVFVICFITAAFFIWLMSKKNLEIDVNDNGMAINYDQGNQKFAWSDVEKIKRPSLLAPWWRFDLKGGKQIKVQTTVFDKPDSEALEQEIKKYI
jgi:hypothetical protein